jgi:hypothetical protein
MEYTNQLAADNKPETLWRLRTKNSNSNLFWVADVLGDMVALQRGFVWLADEGESKIYPGR